MGICVFCGKPAGFLTYKHNECWKRHLIDVQEKTAEEVRLRQAHEAEQYRIMQARGRATTDITSTTLQFIDSDENPADVFNKIKEIASSVGITESEYRELIFQATNSFVVKALETGLIMDPPWLRMMNLLNLVKYNRKDIFQNKNCPILKLVKNEVLLNLNLRKLTPFFDAKTPTGINVDSGEAVVWAFPSTQLYEERIHSVRVGGGAGLSFKVHKGVYLHTGGFAAHTVSHAEDDLIDIGYAVFTNKKIYFAGAHKGFKLDYRKIINFEQYAGGIRIIKDGTSAKPLYLVTGDAWFTYNLANQLADYTSTRT